MGNPFGNAAALAPEKFKKTSSALEGKHATFVASLTAPATDRWHSRATRSSAMDGSSMDFYGGSWLVRRGAAGAVQRRRLAAVWSGVGKTETGCSGRLCRVAAA